MEGRAKVMRDGRMSKAKEHPQHWLKGTAVHRPPNINHPWRSVYDRKTKKRWLLRRLRGLEEYEAIYGGRIQNDYE